MMTCICIIISEQPQYPAAEECWNCRHVISCLKHEITAKACMMKYACMSASGVFWKGTKGMASDCNGCIEEVKICLFAIWHTGF